MRSPLQNIIHETPSHGGWEIAWKKGVTGWDLGGPTKLLVHELKNERNRLFEASSNDTKVGGWKSLVPGCGSGYDLLTLAQHQTILFQHYQKESKSVLGAGTVVGLDISPTSVEKTQAMLDVVTNGKDSDGTSDAAVKVICHDFFKAPFQTNEFDFVFDYTFFCAIPPSLREDWGKRLGDIIAPNGKLLTFAFPIVLSDDDLLEKKKNETLIGPPFPVTIEEYKRMLEPHGFELIFDPKESEFSEDSRKGKELPIWWKKVAF